MIEMQQDLNDSHCIWQMLSTNLLSSKALNSTETHMSQGFGHKDSEASCAQETSEIWPKKSLFQFQILEVHDDGTQDLRFQLFFRDPTILQAKLMKAPLTTIFRF